MKKSIVLIVAVMLAIPVSVAVAGDKAEDDGKLGRLYLFQKCDPSLAPAEEEENPVYDSNGCPLPGNGPWPIIPDNRRWGQMKYNLMGDQFKFSFQGKRLLPETDYTLIYYPDDWPGEGLMCLGTNTSNPDGNMQIHGKLDIPSGLPASYDENFNPIEPSGASGAKIWLVPSMDVYCEGSWEVDGETGEFVDPNQMIGWNPADYLFEANLIVYQYYPEPLDEENDGELDSEEEENTEISSTSSKGKGKSQGRSKSIKRTARGQNIE